jgi:hypothetical protein
LVFGKDLQLPPGGLLLHIGPHKTGTTAIQGAMKQARPRMAEHGVVYAGKVRQHQRAALALTGRAGLIGARQATPKDWNKLVAQAARAAHQRVVVSSEYFDDATDDVARTVIDGLGGDRVHVIVTLRPLAKILPSAWQQYVRNGLRQPYDEWLDALFHQPEGKVTPSFWRRHHHDTLIERWTSVVGPERLLVLVVDETDPGALLRSFERITGLPDGLLELERRTNRSLTAAETELIRAMNVKYVENDWSPEVYDTVFRWGAVEQMQQRTPRAGEAPIVTPPWAIERANEIAAAAAARIVDFGVAVAGDLSTLSQVKPRDASDVNAPDTVAVAAAAEAITGTLIASGALHPEPPAAAADAVRGIEAYPTRELITIIRERARSRAAEELRARRSR